MLQFRKIYFLFIIYEINKPKQESEAASLSVKVVSEIGDNYFFIAVILDMKHLHFTVYISAIFANGLLTVLSVLI